MSTMLPTGSLNDPTPRPREEGGLAFVVLSCLCTCVWVIHITFYHSRLMGYILTRLINLKYIKSDQYFKIGKFIIGTIILALIIACYAPVNFSSVHSPPLPSLRYFLGIFQQCPSQGFGISLPWAFDGLVIFTSLSMISSSAKIINS